MCGVLGLREGDYGGIYNHVNSLFQILSEALYPVISFILFSEGERVNGAKEEVVMF